MEDFDKITKDFFSLLHKGKNEEELEVFIETIKTAIKEVNNSAYGKQEQKESRERRDQGWERSDNGWKRKEFSEEWTREIKFRKSG